MSLCYGPQVGGPWPILRLRGDRTVGSDNLDHVARSLRLLV
jgi:hypothetical protein